MIMNRSLAPLSWDPVVSAQCVAEFCFNARAWSEVWALCMMREKCINDHES